MEHSKKILIVDDIKINRDLLSEILSYDFEIVEASTGTEALAVLEQRANELSLVLLDIIMPDIDGFGVLSAMNLNGLIDSVPVIIISSETSLDVINRAYGLGATEYITKPFDEITVRRRVNNIIALRANQKMLEDMVAEQILEREENNSQLLEVLSNVVEFRNGESGSHVLRIRTVTDIILRHLNNIAPQYDLNAKKISIISNACAMHDIGKISISSGILNKEDKLSVKEYEVLKTHTVEGAKIIANIPDYENSELLKTAYEICRWHHERYNGKGYPDGLKGDEIPIAAQVVAIADVYDLIVSERSFKPVFSHEKALRMIADGECGAFNPLLIRCLLEKSDEIKKSFKMEKSKNIGNLEAEHIVTELLERRELKFSGRTLALLEQEREKTRFYSSMSKEILFEYNTRNKILEISEWGARYLGVPEVITHPFENHVMPEWTKASMQEISEKLKTVSHGNSVIRQTYNIPFNGSDHWFKAAIRPLWDSPDSQTYSRIIGKLTDVTDDLKAVNELKELSEMDTLTVLNNRRAAEKTIDYLLSNCKGDNYILILIDLDYFKQANDNFGHAHGDEILKAIAINIHALLNDGDVAARIGGDEFLMFMSCAENPISFAAKLFKEIPKLANGETVSISMGVAACPTNGTKYEELLYAADVALYTAKREGKNTFRFYDKNMPDFPQSRTPIDHDGNKDCK